MQDALGVLEGVARFEGPAYPVYTQLAEHDGHIVLDLGDEKWRAVAITPDGWHIVDTAPVKFRRAPGLLPLPDPEPCGSLDTLRRFVNVGADSDWRLLVSWVVAALRPTGPYPVLVLHGEQGSAKTTACQVLRRLVEPNSADTRGYIREERDLIISARNGHVVALDNLSGLPAWLSDALCRLSTGAGFATRALYTDDEEVIFHATRPVVLNGIAELATRGDLLDRAIILHLPRIQEERRQREDKFWQEFDAARPRVLGALLDAVSMALREVSALWLPNLPRMADFALWSAAAAPACGWTAGAFLEAYQETRDSVHELALEASPIGTALLVWVAGHTGWEGTVGALLEALEGTVSEKIQRTKGWPKTPRGLSGALKRLAPNLRALGVEITFSRQGHDRTRVISVQNTRFR